MAKYLTTAKKLQTACNKVFGIKLLIDQKQWYHKDKDTAVTVYTLYEANPAARGKASKTQLFQTYSQIQLVLYLRDMWYILNDWEVPTDNEVWEDIKRKYGERHEPNDREPAKDAPSDSNGTAICDQLYKSWKRNRSSKNDS